jgi:LuxR family maltose regulon positive regulatory protein
VGPAAIGRDVLDGSVPCVVPWMLLEAHLLDCRIALRPGPVSAARHALRRAVELAAEAGVVRPLVTAPVAVETLLTRRLGRFGAGDALVRKVLALRAARVHLLPSTPLIGRERDVLELLPTLLSLDEIADALSISVNIVRSHVRALHAKLGVSSRAEAVVAAVRRGLISPRWSDAP